MWLRAYKLYGHLLDPNLAQERGEKQWEKQATNITVSHVFSAAAEGQGSRWALGPKRHSPASTCMRSGWLQESLQR